MVVRMKFPTIDLTKFTDDELCEIHDVLNRWEWDDRLGEKPKNFDKLPWFRTFPCFGKSRDKYIEPIMILIERKVGNYTLLKYRWKNHLHMTDEEIEKETLNRLFSSGIYNR